MLDVQFLERCNATLTEAYRLLGETEVNSVHYDLYRSAIIKEFEVILEQSGKLLKKVLLPYFSSKNALDKLTFAARHGERNAKSSRQGRRGFIPSARRAVGARASLCLKLYFHAVEAYRSKMAKKNTQFSSKPA